MIYKESPNGKFQFFENDIMIAEVIEDELITYVELTDEELQEIKNTASI